MPLSSALPPLKPEIKHYIGFVFQLVKKLISNQNIGYNKNTHNINASKPQ